MINRLNTTGYLYGQSLIGEKGVILVGPTLAVFFILIVLSFTLVNIIKSEEAGSTGYVVGMDAHDITQTGLERGIQQLRRTRVPPFLTQSEFGIGNYTVQFDTTHDETGTPLPWCNYVMINSTGKINFVERNMRLMLSTLPHAFLFPLYSQNLKNKTLNLSGTTSVTGDVYFRGDVKTTVPISGTTYTPSGHTVTTGSITYHPEPQPPFPYFDESIFAGLLQTAMNQSASDFIQSGGTLSLSAYSNNELYVRGDVELVNVTVNGPGKIIATGEVEIERGSVSDGVWIVAKKEFEVEGPSTLGTGICGTQDGVIIYAGGGIYDIEIEFEDVTIYGLVIFGGTTEEQEIENSIFHGAILSYSRGLEFSGSSITGSLVSKNLPSLGSTTISRGPLPLLLSQNIGLEPYIIPGTWLEY